MSFIPRIQAAVLCLLLFTVSALAVDKPITVALAPDGLSQKERMPLQRYLSQQMGSEVKLVSLESYKATEDGLSNGSIDFAYMGGLTYVKTKAAAGIVPLVQRTVDRQFHSLFIAGSGTSIHSLHDLKGRKFAFGDVNSTSGHLIPYSEMKQAGIDPGHDVDFRYSGGHPVTVKLVETGIVDAGALDETVFKSMIGSGKIDASKVRVIYTSKPFVDNLYVARKDVPEAERETFVAALLRLKKGENDDVLGVLRADRFVKANDEEYESLRHVARELKMF